MDNTNIEKAFFYLLKAGLWPKERLNDRFLPLSDNEWTILYQRAKAQTVEAIIYDGILLLSPENLPPRLLQIKWSVQVDRIERSNQLTNKLIVEQYIFFTAYGLRPLLLKGQGLAATYANPLHRVCGDIDWYFESKEELALARFKLKERGIPRLRAGSEVYLWKGGEMDLHDRLFDLYNPFSKKILKRMRADFPDTTLMIDGMPIPILAPDVQLLQVTAHILKHSLAFGIGLRQFCDLASLYSKYAFELNNKRLDYTFGRLGLRRWLTEVHRLLVNHIGLSKTVFPFPVGEEASSLAILEEVWLGGNFGFHDTSTMQRMAGEYVLRKKRTHTLARRFLKYFPYVPKEAFWFPVMHFFDGIKGR
jgi:hypothetical protein